MNWRRWIRPGLAATFLVALLAVFVRDGGIERDLTDRVTAALLADGQSWATVEVSARDVTIRGRAPSTESQETAVRLAARVGGVRHAANGADLLPIVSPYVWSARRDGRSLRLSGNVPSEGGRAAVLAAARRALPEAEIHDEMALARGAPAAFNATTTFSLARLGDLFEGTATLTDATLAVSGTAIDAAAYDRAGTAFAEDLPAAVSLGPVNVLPARADPFVWSADFDGKSVNLAGFVPNDIVRQTLLATLRATLPGVAIDDGTAIASGEPAGFAGAATFAVAALEHLKSGGATLDGLALDVSGDARSVDDHEALLSSLAGPFPKGMTVVASEVTAASVSPYWWRAEKADGAVTLSGYVPTAAARDDAAATARTLFDGAAAVENRIRVATGEPRMDWIGAINFAMGELAGLERGSVTVGDKTYEIEGEARSGDAYAAIAGTNAKTLPASLELKRAEVTPPGVSPYRFVAERRGGGLVISGHVPDEASREAIFAAAHHKFGAVEIVGDLIYASGAPAGYVDAVSAALQVLSRVAGGRAEIADAALSVSGFVFQPAAVDDIADTIAGALPDGFAVAENTLATRQGGQPVAAERCSELLRAALKTGRIEFDGNKAGIAGDSYGLLDRVSASVARCPDASIEVGAHSDSEGSSSRNRDRTQARAEAIVDFLVNAGVKRERLSAVGYGESNPIADNGTAEGKAANRRIEFSVELPGGG